MKKRILTTVIIALLVFCACGKDAYVPVGFKLLSDKGADYRVFVPTEWKEDLSTGFCSAFYSDTDRSNISFTAFELDDSTFSAAKKEKSAESSDMVEVTETITVREAEASANTDSTAPVTTDEALPSPDNISDIDGYWSYYEAQFKATFGNMTYETEGENTVISGIKSKKYVYTATVTGGEYKYLQTVTVKNGAVYIFTYTSTPANFEAHLEDVNSMLGYIEIK